MRPAKRQGLFDGSNRRRIQTKPRAGTMFAQMVGRTRPRDGNDMVGTMHKPCDRQRRGACSHIGSQFAEFPRRLDIGCQVRFLKAWIDLQEWQCFRLFR